MTTYKRRKIDLIIDVRSRFEFIFGHIATARCIPLDALEQRMNSLRGIGRESAILVYCASGSRSKLAADMLRKLGYARVVDGGPLQRMRIEAKPGGALIFD
ncbi:MAG: rhodanese-like domain-containing protein [Gemmatimonadaceae bacterium]